MEGEIIAQAHEAINEAVTAATVEGAIIAEAIVEGAQERIDNAEAIAQQIADAALATALGERIGNIERTNEEWRAERELFKTQLAELLREIAELRETMTASLTLQVVKQPPMNISTPPISPALLTEVKEATEAVTEALPGNLSESAVVENPVPLMPKKAKRFL